MGKHVIVGAGHVGKGAAGLLAARGHEVIVVSRRGTAVAGTTAVAADAADAQRLTEIAKGADALYSCANPAYHRWSELWPPIAAALLHAAETSGAVLVALNNVYGYGPVTEPMTEDMPFQATTVKGALRAKMWHDALALHEAGRIRTTEARASDFVGGRDASVLDVQILSKVASGAKRVSYLGDPDMPHAWTYIPDVAETLAVIGTNERAWGRPWHVPTNPALSARQAAQRAAELVGVAPPKISRVPYAVFWTMGAFNPLFKAMREMSYQFTRPFELDSRLTEQTFGLAPTGMDEVLRSSTLAYRRGAS